MFNTIVILGILSVSSSCLAFDKWTTKDYILEGALVGAVVIDYCQSLDIIHRPTRYEESNPCLEKHPRRRDFVAFGFMCLTSQIILTHITPAKHRWINQTFFIGIETGVIFHNYRIGMKMYFPWK